MNALMNFVIVCVELVIVGGLIYATIPKIAPDPWLSRMARYAVGGAILLAFLFAVAAVFGMGGAGALPPVNPAGILEFAAGLIILVVVLMIIYMVIDRFAAGPAPGAPPGEPALVGGDVAGVIKLVIGAVAIIALLMLAAKAIFGGGLGVIPAGTFRLGR